MNFPDMLDPLFAEEAFGLPKDLEAMPSRLCLVVVVCLRTCHALEPVPNSMESDPNSMLSVERVPNSMWSGHHFLVQRLVLLVVLLLLEVLLLVVSLLQLLVPRCPGHTGSCILHRLQCHTVHRHNPSTVVILLHTTCRCCLGTKRKMCRRT